MNIPIDRRAWPGTMMLLILGITLRLFSMPGWWMVLILTLLHLAFFRDPVRVPPAGDGAVSPADGVVVEVSEMREDRYLKSEAVKIGIFLSVFIPHVNRSPTRGKVGYLCYEPGKFLNALFEASVIENESNWIGLEFGGIRVLARQIAGAIARRIHCDVEFGGEVDRGQKIGIICYGSRAECYLPKRAFRPIVKIGDRVKAGSSLLAERVL